MTQSHLKSVHSSETVTRQERVKQKELAIITAAQGIFLANGFYGTTMSMIARASGVADGTLYTYFKNKEGLARAVVSNFYRDLTKATQMGVDALCTTEERLRFLAKNHFTEIMGKRQILEMLPLIHSSLMQYGKSEFFELNKAYSMIFDRIIKDGKAKGDINDALSPWIIRDIFYGALDYTSRTMMIKNRETDIDIVVEEIISVIMTQKTPETSETTQETTALIDRLEAVTTRMETALDGKV